jgi:nitroreductase
MCKTAHSVPQQGAHSDIFERARTHTFWSELPLSDELLRQVYTRAAYGPTSLNCQPMRVVFVRSEAAKQRLLPCLNRGNVEKTRRAPVTAIIGFDLEFFDKSTRTFPGRDLQDFFAAMEPNEIERMAFRNATLQAAYLIISARSFGLAAGPMSGFDADAVNREFFGARSIRANFLCNLGYPSSGEPGPRKPRLSFEETCQLL